MKYWNRFLSILYTLVILYICSQLIILGWGLWELNEVALATVFFALAIWVFWWPDPNDRKINNSIRNPYNKK